MEILTGFADRIVWQRTTRDVSDAEVTGVTAIRGEVTARVEKNGKALPGWARKKVGSASRKRFRARIRELPAGGPYDITLTAKGKSGGEENCTARGVLVGDVWLLAGQSNMEGIGFLADAETPRKEVRAFYMDDRWDTAKDPIHNITRAVDPVHADLAGGMPPQRAAHIGVGPGVAFGVEMARRTGVPQGLIACAHGGTSLTQWDPKRKKEKGKSLYGAMIRRFEKNGGQVAGMLWYQGCSDASEESAPRYADRLRAFLRAVRKDTGKAKLPVGIVQIAAVRGCFWNPVCWNQVQEAQRLVASKDRHAALVPAIDLALDDGIHISGKEQNRLGRRLAYAMDALRRGRKAGLPPIEPAGIRIRNRRDTGLAEIVVEYRHVAGALAAPGRPEGFELLDASGPTRNIVRVDLEKNRAILRTSYFEQDLETMRLQYGGGTSPYCNIVDADDRSLPVLGPVPVVAVPAARLPFVQTLLVSSLRDGPADWKTLPYPQDRKALGLGKRTFPTNFCNVNPEFYRAFGEEKVCYFACGFRCETSMDLLMHFGYDGPAKVWVDGEERFVDPRGTNPARPYDKALPLPGRKGAHEILVALGSNGGRACGIFLRLERRDVSAARRRKGPGAYAMPVIEA